MKSITLAALLFIVSVNAQVKIGDNINTPVDNSEALRIESSSKGILIPSISIPDLNQAAPVSNPTDFLLVYNTNTTTTKGYHYWKDNKWETIIDSDNIYKKLGIVKYYSVGSTSAVTDNTLNTPTTYNLDEAPSSHEWTLIPGVSKQVTITEPVNNIGVTVSGVVQTNRSISNDSYAIAIFVDGKLKATRSFVLKSNSSCAYDIFNVQAALENLPIGNHTFEVRETYRNKLRSGGNATLSFGAKNTACSNINNAMARTNMSIKLVQK